VDLGTAAALATEAEGLERFVLVAGIGPAQALDWAGQVGATGLQPYGPAAGEVASAAEAHGLRVLRPVRMVAAEPPDLTQIPPTQMPLLDAAKQGVLGGTGETFDWGLVAGLEREFVLAGGLGPDNVGRAIGAVHPWGVDASSRLESAPGEKDPVLILRFVEEAKNS
jgi:phosphoribosylanthranilate isomerase